MRFSEIKKRVNSSSTTVARRLGELEDHGLVIRTAFATVPATVTYELTEMRFHFNPVSNLCLNGAQSCWSSAVWISTNTKNRSIIFNKYQHFVNPPKSLLRNTMGVQSRTYAYGCVQGRIFTPDGYGERISSWHIQKSCPCLIEQIFMIDSYNHATQPFSRGVFLRKQGYISVTVRVSAL